MRGERAERTSPPAESAIGREPRRSSFDSILVRRWWLFACLASALIALCVCVETVTANSAQGVSGAPAQIPAGKVLTDASSPPGDAVGESVIEDLGPISCTTPKTCVVAATSAQAGVLSEAILTTFDRGAHWTLHPLPGPQLHLTGLVCSSIAVCVAVGSNVANDGHTFGNALDSLDGGRTWNVSNLPPQVVSLDGVACPFPGTCLAVGATDGGNTALILRTQDAGASWQRLDLPSGEASLGSISCPSLERCIAVGGGRSGWADRLLVSNNQGRTWQRSTVRTLITQGAAISCPSVTTCILVSGSPSVGDQVPFGLIVETTNAGVFWLSPVLPPGVPFLTGISCHTTAFCMAVGACGSCGAAVLTKSGDKTAWTRPALPSGIKGGVFAVSCSSVTTCAVDGRDLATPPRYTVAWTTDRGRKWSGSVVGAP